MKWPPLLMSITVHQAVFLPLTNGTLAYNTSHCHIPLFQRCVAAEVITIARRSHFISVKQAEIKYKLQKPSECP